MIPQEHKFCMGMSVLETQQARFKWLQQQQQLLHDYAGRHHPVQSFPVPQFLGSFDVNLPKHGDLSAVGAEYAGNKMGFLQAELAPRSLESERCLSRTSSCQIGLAEVAKMENKLVDAEKSDVEAITIGKLQPSLTGNISIKRKVEFVATAEECKYKRIKEEAELQSKAKKRSSTEISSGSSKEERKDSQVQKPDYIHVRVRRGQATDSHSLAERARREKISKKMKCLQDLVPGCNKVTGRTGMLDEIINYVQSLQRQVEFLSMKLAALNSCPGLNVGSFSAKEFPAHIASFRTAAAISSAVANWGHLQLNLVQQHSAESDLEVLTNPAQVAPRGPQTAQLSILKHNVLTHPASLKFNPFGILTCKTLTLLGFINGDHYLQHLQRQTTPLDHLSLLKLRM